MTRQRRERGISSRRARRRAGVEQSADLGTVLFWVIPKPIGQLGAEVPVREAVYGVLPAHERHEQLVVGPGHRAVVCWVIQRESGDRIPTGVSRGFSHVTTRFLCDLGV